MKVLCIDAKNSVPLPISEGGVYEVDRQINLFGCPAYLLIHALDCPLDVDRFIPLSTIDETELIEQRQTLTA